MTSDPTWTPSADATEVGGRAIAHRNEWLWDVLTDEARTHYRLDAKAALTAAVAFRHPDGHPELVPWEQVRELVDAAREAEPWLDYLDANHAPDWAPNEASIVAKDLGRLRAALAPFTQEPEA